MLEAVLVARHVQPPLGAQPGPAGCPLPKMGAVFMPQLSSAASQRKSIAPMAAGLCAHTFLGTLVMMGLGRVLKSSLVLMRAVTA